MNGELQPAEDLHLLRDSARRVLGETPSLETLTRGGDVAGLTRRHWQLAVQVGWTGLLIPTTSGGAGMGTDALAVLAEELGAHFFCGPFLGTAVLGAAVAGLAARHGTMLDLDRGIADGSMALAAAAATRQPDLAIGPGTVTGVCALIEHPGLATHFLAVDLRDGRLRAALIPSGTDVTATPCQPLDPSCPLGTLNLDSAPAQTFETALDADECDGLLRPVHIAVAAELVGIARSAIDRAVAYAKERRQFGQPIGAFQAIKHRLADAFVLLDNARLAVAHAARVDDDPAAVASARVLAADAALRAAGDYIQVQGGLGISWESDAHLHLKRARRLAASFGSSQGFRQALLDRFIASVLGQAAPASA